MTTTDIILGTFSVISAAIIIVIGGVYLPGTMAGAVARFVFSMSV